MKIGIIGYGTLGQAMFSIFPTAKVYDKYKKIGCLNDVIFCDIIFICVPTPVNEKGFYELKELESTIARLGDTILVIKSTIPPGTCDRLVAKHKKKIVFNPEFLREKSANADMKNAHWTILAGPKELVEEVKLAYSLVYPPNHNYKITNFRTAELTKLTINGFLSTKVSYFNTIFDICKAFGVNYNELLEAVLLDPRIGISHCRVTPERGFGGKCLPKDLMGLATASTQAGYYPELLAEIYKYNKSIRKEKDLPC